MERKDYMAAMRIGAPVEFRGIRYQFVSAVVCRRSLIQTRKTDAPLIYIELELYDKSGHSVTMADPREVHFVDEEGFRHLRDAAEAGEKMAGIQSGKPADAGGTGSTEASDPKDCGDARTDPNACASGGKSGKKRFVKPSADEIAAYCAEKGYTHVDAVAFLAHYDSVGWKVGKNPMVSWRAAVTGWETREKKNAPHAQTQTGSFATDDFFAAAVRRAYE